MSLKCNNIWIGEDAGGREVLLFLSHQSSWPNTLRKMPCNLSSHFPFSAPQSVSLNYIYLFSPHCISHFCCGFCVHFSYLVQGILLFIRIKG